MKFMVIVKATPESEAGIMPSERLLTEMTTFNEELVAAGVMKAGEGLHPSAKGVRVNHSKSGVTVVDGPFAETKELAAGFWIWECASMEEAIEWAKKMPNPDGTDGTLEIRPAISDEDFGDALTPEIEERVARMREQAEGAGQS